MVSEPRTECRAALGCDGSARHSAGVSGDLYAARPMPRGVGEARWYHESEPLSSLMFDIRDVF